MRDEEFEARNAAARDLAVELLIAAAQSDIPEVLKVGDEICLLVGSMRIQHDTNKALDTTTQ